MARVILSLMVKALLIRQAETRAQMTRAPFLKTDIKKTENYINTFIMARHTRTHNRFMEILDAILPIADGMPDYKEPFALPAEHELNTAFVEAEPEKGQGYNWWTESPKPEELKPYVPEHDPSVRTTALIVQAKVKLEAVALKLTAYSEKTTTPSYHRSKAEKRKRLDLLEDEFEGAKRNLKLLCGGFQ